MAFKNDRDMGNESNIQDPMVAIYERFGRDIYDLVCAKNLNPLEQQEIIYVVLGKDVNKYARNLWDGYRNQAVEIERELDLSASVEVNSPDSPLTDETVIKA